MNDINSNSQAATGGVSSLSFVRKLGYGLGSSASNFIWQMVSFYLLFFYTDVFGITAAAAGIIMLGVRIFDGVNDVVEGYIVDRTRSRWGRFRPYLLIGSVPIALILVLTFSTPPFPPEFKVAYAAIMYVLLGSAYSFMTIAHSSLMVSMTQDTNERSSLASVLAMCVYTTILIVAAGTMPLVTSFSSQQTGFTMTAAIYGILAVGLYLICFKNTREITYAQTKKHSFREALVMIAQNKFLLLLLLAHFFFQAANDMRTSAAIYFFKYNVGKESFYPIFMAIVILSMIGGASFAPLLGRKLGSKRNLYITGTLIVIAANLIALFTPYDDLLKITISLAVSSFGIGITYVMVRSMLADTVEFGEWKTGIRSEGILFSTFGITQKLGYAVGGSLSAFLMASAGYVPNVVQSREVQSIFLYMLTLFPVIAGILSIIIMLFYKIDTKYYNTILQEISSRHKKEISRS